MNSIGRRVTLAAGRAIGPTRDRAGSGMLQRQRDPSLHERVVSPLPCCYNSHPCCCSCSILASLIILVDAHVPSLRPSSSSVLLIMFNACERVVPCERVVAPLTVQETLMFDPCARVVAPCSSLLMLMFDPCERVVAPLTVQETLMIQSHTDSILRWTLGQVGALHATRLALLSMAASPF